MVVAGIAAGEDKAFSIERYAGAVQPISIRGGTNKQEQVPDRTPYFLAGRIKPPADRFQHAVAPFNTADCCIRYDLDVGEAADAINQIA